MTDTPDVAARKIVEEYCADMPDEKKRAIIKAIEKAIWAWGNQCAEDEAESYRGLE